MNCDQVFDILTRGPFPTGEKSDVQVEHHLTACHDCRQLAEALRPAIATFHESIASDECLGLPGYRGKLDSSGATSLSSSIMTAIDSEPKRIDCRMIRPLSTHAAQSNWRRFTAAVLLGAALCLAVLALALPWTPFGENQQSTDIAFSMTIDKLDDRGQLTLAALNLPGACFRSVSSSSNAMFAQQESDTSMETVYQCCTQCHAAANSQRPSIQSVAALTRSCNACHHR